MSLRSRRAMPPRSTSASTTTRPETMCRPPANRSSEATSALRHHGVDDQPAQLVLHLRRHRHGASPLGPLSRHGRPPSHAPACIGAAVGAVGGRGRRSPCAHDRRAPRPASPGHERCTRPRHVSKLYCRLQQARGAAKLVTFPLRRHRDGVDDDLVHGETGACSARTCRCCSAENPRSPPARRPGSAPGPAAPGWP